MATNLLLVLILIASVITAAHSRILIQLNNGFHPQISVALSAEEDSASYAYIPTGVGEGRFTTESSLISSIKQQYILKAVVVTMILTLISSVTIVVLRTICYRHRSIGTDEENGPRSTGTGSAGPERPNSEDNESRLIGIEGVGPERPIYEPRPIPETVLNYELTIFSCNFPLCGVPV